MVWRFERVSASWLAYIIHGVGCQSRVLGAIRPPSIDSPCKSSCLKIYQRRSVPDMKPWHALPLLLRSFSATPQPAGSQCMLQTKSMQVSSSVGVQSVPCGTSAMFGSFGSFGLIWYGPEGKIAGSTVAIHRSSLGISQSHLNIVSRLHT